MDRDNLGVLEYMSEKKKLKASLVPIWEKEKIQQYYSDMAMDGFFVCGKSVFHEEFILGQGEKRSYAIMLHNNLSNDELQDIQKLGWERNLWYDDCLVISTNQENLVLPFEEDTEAWSKYLKKIEKTSRELVIILAAFIFMILLSFVLELDLLGIFFAWISGYLFLWGVKCFMKNMRARKVRQEVFWGKKDDSSWKDLHRTNQIYWVVFSFFIMTHIIYYI